MFALIIVASIVPVLRGAERRSFLFFTSGAEVYLGRWAMLVRVAQCMGKKGIQRHGTWMLQSTSLALLLLSHNVVA